MISPQVVRPHIHNATISIWHRDIGDLLLPGGGKIPLGDLAIFCNKLSFLLDAGVLLKDALPIIAKQSRGRFLRRILPEVNKRILKGESLADACTAVQAFPLFVCGMFNVGEKTAQLPRICAQLGNYYDRKVQTYNELRAALLYPAMVTLMMLGVVVMAVTFVLPGYAQIFAASDITLPSLTQGLLHISDFVVSHGILLLTVVALAMLGLIIFARGAIGRGLLSWLALRFLVFRVGISLHVVQVLELMVHAGQPLSEALTLCATSQDNTCAAKDLTRVAYEVSAGKTLAASLSDIKYLEPMLSGMIHVGEESGRLPQTLSQCRIHFETLHKRAVQRLNKLVEPFITIIMGILLALVMLAIVLPTFELASAF